MGQLQLLVAERDVKNVVLRYCRGVDRMDLALVRSCYHHDAQEHHGEFADGIDGALRWVWDVLATYESTVHLVANMLVELDPLVPTVARCESYGAALHFAGGEDGRPGQGIGFRWIDDLENRASLDEVPEWRFSRRVATTEWIRKYADGEFAPIPDRWVKGRRDRTDPVYALFSSGAGRPGTRPPRRPAGSPYGD
jgi:SnoaL-like domain